MPQVNSFKAMRKSRRKGRLKRQLEKALIYKKTSLQKAIMERPTVGPTRETLAKLQPDPLVRFRKMDILNDQQIWAFKRIRCAVQIITDGTRMRVSSCSDVTVQASHYDRETESEFEIRIKEHYSHWIDRMMTARLPAGPVLDVIIDELSLSGVDRKWGRRKGWAKDHLQASLDLYSAFSSSSNRNG